MKKHARLELIFLIFLVTKVFFCFIFSKSSFIIFTYGVEPTIEAASNNANKAD